MAEFDLPPDPSTEPQTLSAAVVRNASLAPSRGFIFQDSAGVETFLNFCDLEKRTRELASIMYARGWRRQDRAVIVAHIPQDFVLCFLAAVRLGVVPVPLYSPTPVMNEGLVRRSVVVTRAAGAKWLVAPAQSLTAIATAFHHDDALPDLVSPVDLQRDAPQLQAPMDRSISTDTAYLQFTSGSTESPKGVVLTHRALRNNSEAIRRRLRVDVDQDRGVSWLPLGHDMGLIGFVIAPVFWSGPTCVLTPTSRFIRYPSSWMETIHQHRGSITFAPPYALSTACRSARAAQLQRWDLSCLHTLGVGGEPINPLHLSQFNELFGTHCHLQDTAVTPAYGLAEASLAVAINPRSRRMRTRRVDRRAFIEQGVVKSAPDERAYLVHISCGTPVADTQIAIVDDLGRALPDGHEGHIRVHSNALCEGYLTAQGVSRDCFKGTWLDTGDRGYLHKGELYPTGRSKQLIVIHGTNHHPETIEWAICNALELPPGTIAAFSRPGERTEELVIAVELRQPVSDDLNSRIRDVVRSAFALAVADVAVEKPGGLLRTPSGKLRRNDIRERYLRKLIASAAISP